MYCLKKAVQKTEAAKEAIEMGRKEAAATKGAKNLYNDVDPNGNLINADLGSETNLIRDKAYKAEGAKSNTDEEKTQAITEYLKTQGFTAEQAQDISYKSMKGAGGRGNDRRIGNAIRELRARNEEKAQKSTKDMSDSDRKSYYALRQKGFSKPKTKLEENAAALQGYSTGRQGSVKDMISSDRTAQAANQEILNQQEGVINEGRNKTGFFCDQRDNRRAVVRFAKDARVLDLCCYTGGFSLNAKVMGGAAEVTSVDLDEVALEQAKRNANLNQVRLKFVHADAFAYARQMQQNGEKWDVVVLDPPKFIFTRDAAGNWEGRQKYEDLNLLAISLVKPGGIFVTCSCSGLLSLEDFEAHVIKAAHRQSRRLQFFDRTGPGVDHPVYSNCLESRYLKVLWARVV